MKPAELGSLVAAERAGVAQLHVAITMGRIGPGFVGLLETSLTELSTMAGLPPGRGAELLLHGDSLTSVPAALDSGDLTLGESEAEPASDGRGRIWRFRTDAPAQARLPAAWGNPDEPLVYVSYGSVTARQPEFAPIYDATLRALADLQLRVLMTTGLGPEPAALEPIPPDSRIEQWWPRQAVIGEAAAVVGHGRFGPTMAALSAGVPQVVLPLFSFDHAVNARPVAEVTPASNCGRRGSRRRPASGTTQGTGWSCLPGRSTRHGCRDCRPPMYPRACRSWNNSSPSARRETSAVTENPSMRERMLAGELYIADDPVLAEQSARARGLIHRFNTSDPRAQRHFARS